MNRHQNATFFGIRRGESEAEFARRCKMMILEYHTKHSKPPLPQVNIVSVESDPYAIRSDMINGMPRWATLSSPSYSTA